MDWIILLFIIGIPVILIAVGTGAEFWPSKGEVDYEEAKRLKKEIAYLKAKKEIPNLKQQLKDLKNNK